MKFGENLKSLRKEKNISQEELATKLNISRQTISKYENGEVYPDINVLTNISKTLKYDINYLVSEEMSDFNNFDDDIKNLIKSRDSKKIMKSISKVIYIVSKICRIFTLIGLAFLVPFMFILPILVSNIKVTDSYIKVYNEKIEYQVDNSTLILKNDDINERIEFNDINIKEFINNYQKHSNLEIILIIELAFIFIILTLLVTIMILLKLEKLFKNIYDKDTPFTIENIDYIKMIGKLLIISLIIPLLFSLIFNLLISYDINFNLGLEKLLTILVVFTLAYIFEYGYKIEQKKKV